MRSIVWFRKGLRLHDNPALHAAIKESSSVFPVFVIDPHFAKPEFVGINRYRFMLESLRDLDSSLRSKKSRLYVLKGKPEDVLPSVMKKWKIDLLTFEKDIEPYARVRDEKITRLAKSSGVKVKTFTSHTMFDPEYLFKLSGGKVHTSYRSFQKVLSKAGQVPKPLKSPSIVPLQGAMPKGSFEIPTLKDMGYKESKGSKKNKKKDIKSFFSKNGKQGFDPTHPFVGGETVALKRLSHYLKRKEWLLAFEKPKTSPNALDPSTTVLSPYLKFGCLSVRTFWHELEKIYHGAPKRSRPPVSMDGQLLWREFYYYVAANTPNYDKMVGNPICRQIPWKNNDAHLKAWTEGRTGYPWIDAAMTQLREQGWIHHLARHAVACFLTRGDLWISWEEGARVFNRLLLDADWSLNNGNWMWLSASCFFYQYFRVYGPVSFGKKTDKDGQYIRKWIPQLAKFPKKYIYEPWKAPLELQKQCGCMIGRDYPFPIVDHNVVKQRNIDRMKTAYAAHKKSALGGNGATKKRKRV